MVQCSLLFLRRDDQILLAMKKRGFGQGWWNGVGGKLDAGETTEQAMVREAQEEIGVTPTAFLKVAELVFKGGGEGEGWGMFVHVYIATKWEGDPSESEEMLPQWFRLAEIPYNKMWPDDKFWLPLVLEGKQLNAAFTFDGQNKLVAQAINVVDGFDD